MKKLGLVILCIVVVIAISVSGIYGRWFNTYVSNKVEYVDRKIDDATRYETKKKVEDTCRAMIASYESDKRTYLQYINSDVPEERNWANMAKMRANNTVSTYNNYILENSYVWSGNVPSAINNALAYLE